MCICDALEIWECLVFAWSLLELKKWDLRSKSGRFRYHPFFFQMKLYWYQWGCAYRACCWPCCFATNEDGSDRTCCNALCENGAACCGAIGTCIEYTFGITTIYLHLQQKSIFRLSPQYLSTREIIIRDMSNIIRALQKFSFANFLYAYEMLTEWVEIITGCYNNI